MPRKANMSNSGLSNKTFDLSNNNVATISAGGKIAQKSTSGTIQFTSINSFQINSFINKSTPENYYLLNGKFNFITPSYNFSGGNFAINVSNENFRLE